MKEGKIIYDGDVEEAIRIYSDESFRFDLSRTYTQPAVYPRRQEAAVLGIDIIERDNLMLSHDDKLKVRIHTRILQPVENMAFIVSPRYAGTNLVGSYVSEIISSEMTDCKDVDLTLDVSNFAPGKYFCDLRVVSHKHGKVRYHEDLQAAFGFEVTSNPSSDSFGWDIGKWGYTILPMDPVTVHE